MNLETLWLAYQSNLKAFLHKNVSNPNDVEDLLQEILIKTHQNLGQLKDSKKVKSWLFQIANHTIIDFYRKRGNAQDPVESELWYTQAEKEVFEQLSQCILPFINGLSDDEASLLRAIEIEGISQKAYAAQQGIKYSTLKSRVNKSRQNLYHLFNACCELPVNGSGQLVDFIARSKSCSNC